MKVSDVFKPTIVTATGRKVYGWNPKIQALRQYDRFVSNHFSTQIKKP